MAPEAAAMSCVDLVIAGAAPVLAAVLEAAAASAVCYHARRDTGEGASDDVRSGGGGRGGGGNAHEVDVGALEALVADACALAFPAGCELYFAETDALEAAGCGASGRGDSVPDSHSARPAGVVHVGSVEGAGHAPPVTSSEWTARARRQLDRGCNCFALGDALVALAFLQVPARPAPPPLLPPPLHAPVDPGPQSFPAPHACTCSTAAAAADAWDALQCAAAAAEGLHAYALASRLGALADDACGLREVAGACGMSGVGSPPRRALVRRSASFLRALAHQQETGALDVLGLLGSDEASAAPAGACLAPYVHPALTIGTTPSGVRGVFATSLIPRGTLLLVSHWLAAGASRLEASGVPAPAWMYDDEHDTLVAAAAAASPLVAAQLGAMWAPCTAHRATPQAAVDYLLLRSPADYAAAECRAAADTTPRMSPAELHEVVAENRFFDGTRALPRVHAASSLLNHSCAPNTARVRLRGAQLYHAAVDVPVGTMLCTSYAPCAALPRSARRELVGMEERGFVCACERCSAGGAADSPAARSLDVLGRAAATATARVAAAAGCDGGAGALTSGSLLASADVLGHACADEDAGAHAAVGSACVAAWRAQSAAVGIAARCGGLRITESTAGGEARVADVKAVLRAEGMAPALMLALAAASCAAARRVDALDDVAEVAADAYEVLQRVAPAGPEQLLLARDMVIAAGLRGAADDDAVEGGGGGGSGDASVGLREQWRGRLAHVIAGRYGATGEAAERFAAHMLRSGTVLL